MTLTFNKQNDYSAVKKRLGGTITKSAKTPKTTTKFKPILKKDKVGFTVTMRWP